MLGAGRHEALKMWYRKLEVMLMWVPLPVCKAIPRVCLQLLALSLSSVCTIISASAKWNFPPSSIVDLVAELRDDLPCLIVYYLIIMQIPLKHPYSCCVDASPYIFEIMNYSRSFSLQSFHCLLGVELLQ